MNETTELKCPCGDSLIPGPDATEEYINAWLTEHANHKTPEVVAAPVEVVEVVGAAVEVVEVVEVVDVVKAERVPAPPPKTEPEPEKHSLAKLDVPELCRREGYASRSYADSENTVILADAVDALVCARALRKKGFQANVSGLILTVQAT